MIEVITIAALVVGPVLAVWIGQKLQDRKADADRKFWVLSQLWGGRHAHVSFEYVRALNSIDVVFRKDARVRQLWKDYHALLNNPGMNNPSGHAQWETAKKLLLTEMARVLGLGAHLTSIDVERVYIPDGLVIPEQRALQIQEELLRVLQNSESLSPTPRVKGTR